MRIDAQGAGLRQLRTLFNVGAIGELSDGQLLERFSAGPREVAELAFAAIVERHAAMVARVCGSLLADPHDAQDAAQATFLILVRKARGLWVRDSLGPWLHQVACRVSGASRSAAMRRRLKERRAAELSAAAVGPDVGIDDDLRLALHAEIARLPDRYRVPLVLCDLEGRTCEQAARLMGRPVGTVKSWRARGRERLRLRLVRRGLAPSAAIIGVFAADAARGASLRIGASGLARMAARITEVGAVPASVKLLMQGRLDAMRLGKLRLAVLVLGASGLGVGLGVWPRVDAQVPNVPPVAPRPALPVEAGTTRPLSLREALKIGLENSPSVRLGIGETPDAGLRLVVLTRAEADRPRATAAITALVRSASQQYWALVAAGTRVRASEAAVKFGEEALFLERAKLATGSGRIADVAAVEEQLVRFKLQYVSDTSDIITFERQLRSILGMPPADNRPIVPTSVPFDGPPTLDLPQSLATMMERQPDIVAARGTAGKEAAPEFMKQVIDQTTRGLQRFYMEVDSKYKQLTTARRLKAAAIQRMEGAKVFVAEGRWGVEQYLDAVNRWSTSLAREADYLAAYNADIVGFEESKGTLLDHAQIHLDWEPAPPAGGVDEPRYPRLAPAEARPLFVEPPRIAAGAMTAGRTYSFHFAIGSGPKPTEVRGSFTVGPPTP